jgi:hypothetical protein
MAGMMGGGKVGDSPDPLSNLIKLLGDPAAFKAAIDEHNVAAQKHSAAAASAREALVDVQTAKAALQSEKDAMAERDGSLNQWEQKLAARAQDLAAQANLLSGQRSALDSAVLKLEDDRKAAIAFADSKKSEAKDAVAATFASAAAARKAADDKLNELLAKESSLAAFERGLQTVRSELDTRQVKLRAAEDDHAKRVDALKKLLG